MAAPQRTPAAGFPALQFDNKGPPEIDPSEITCYEQIGAGCFGTVSRGLCRGKEVAVKKLFQQNLSEKALNSFKKEVDICSRIHHPNVVLFMGASTKPPHMAIVTELMPKGNLQQILHDPNLHLSLYMRIKMAKDAALGINWLHCSNPQIIHRDLKPSNLLLDANGTVKVCDFGLSALREAGQVLKDKSGAIPGTPLWMAPEVMLGKTLDEKTDVYSYGLILWEIATLKEPFAGITSWPVFRKAVCEEGLRPPIPADMLPRLKQLITRCWDARPSVRPSFAQIIPILDETLVDCAVSDEVGREFWKKHFLGKESVHWDAFSRAFAELLCLPPPSADDLNFICLRAILAKKDPDPTLKDPPSIVNLERFGAFLGFFGPLSTKPQPFTILDKVRQLLECPYFHGEVSKEQADQLLSKQPPGTYLLRLSTTREGTFTISKVSRSGNVNHQRIEHNRVDNVFSVVVPSPQGKKVVSDKYSLPHLIEVVAPDLELLIPCPGSPFESIFNKSQRGGGYLSDGYLTDYIDLTDSNEAMEM